MFYRETTNVRVFNDTHQIVQKFAPRLSKRRSTRVTNQDFYDEAIREKVHRDFGEPRRLAKD